MMMMMEMNKLSVLVFSFLALLAFPEKVSCHDTPCNVNNDTLCVEGVRQEFVRTDFWFGDGYYERCPNGTANMDFKCMNPDLNYTSIASRLLRQDSFNTSLIQQFLRIRFNTPSGLYVACGHQFDVSAYSMTIDLDNTHTIYLDSWILGHRPTVTFDHTEGQLYTLVAYDAGYVRLGGMWVNIDSGDSATGQELYPYMGPVNPLYQLINPFVFALFKQNAGVITNIEGRRKEMIREILTNAGHYYLDRFINDTNLEGPVAVGYITITTDPFGIQHFVDRNIYNNCPYLVSKQPDVMKALQVMGYRLTDANSYSDYRGAFLTSLEVDLSVTYFSPEAHFDSCCQHGMMSAMEVTVDPLDSSPIMPLYTRNQPYVKLSPLDLRSLNFATGKLYTLFLLDATDAVNNVSSPNVVIHWQVVNIPGDTVDKGDVVLPYLFPLPRSRSEVRTFMFLLLAQTVRVDPAALWSYTGSGCDSRTALRCKFDLGSFLKHLNFQLSGLTVFRSQQDAFSRAVLYGAVDPQRLATSMSQFMAMAKPDVQSTMTQAEVCQGVPDYAEPCPSKCPSVSSTDNSQGTGATVTTAATTADMHMDHMSHNHAK